MPQNLLVGLGWGREVEFNFEVEFGQPEQVRGCRDMYDRKWSTCAVHGFFGLLFVGVVEHHVYDVTVDNRGWALGVGAVGAAITSVEWANLAKAYETGDFLFFYLANGLAVVLPRRVVPCDELRNLGSAVPIWVSERAQLLVEHAV